VPDTRNETERRGRGDHSKQKDHVQLLRLKDFDPARSSERGTHPRGPPLNVLR
jgi:hypothetical protein